MREYTVQPIPQLPCCRAYAAQHGLGEDVLCPSCADYRHYRQDVLGKVPHNEIPAGFQHTMYSASEETRNGKAPSAKPPRRTPTRRSPRSNRRR